MPWRRKWQPTPVFCLENPMDRGAGQATVHGVAKRRTWLNACANTHTHTHTHTCTHTASHLDFSLWYHCLCHYFSGFLKPPPLWNLGLKSHPSLVGCLSNTRSLWAALFAPLGRQQDKEGVRTQGQHVTGSVQGPASAGGPSQSMESME